MQIKQKLIVFPTSRAIREHLLLNKSSNSLLPFFLTIDDFFKKSFFFNNKKLIDEEHKFLLLKESIKFDDFKKLGISSNFTQFLKQSDYIFRFFTEISSEKVDINEIKNVDTYEFYKEHLEILNKIKINYIELLEKNNFIDRVNEANHYKLNKDFLNKFEEIELNFEGYFTKVEFDKILQISENTKLIINLFTNEYNKKSIEAFKSIGFELEENKAYKLDISNKKILEETQVKSILQNFEIKGFASRINQIAYIKATIVSCIQSGVEPSKIVLIVPDEGFINKLKLFDNEGYFNFAMGLDITNSKSYKLLYTLFNLFSDEEFKIDFSIEFFKINKDFLEFIKQNWNNQLTLNIFEFLEKEVLQYEDNEEIIVKLNELFYKFKVLFFTNNSYILVKEALKILLQKIQKTTIDDVNSGKITVMGLLESRAVNFEVVIICDFNEEFIPKISLKDKFLSTKVKEYANLPTIKDRENLQKYYYKRLINNCKSLYVCYTNNELSFISRFASELFNRKIDNRVFDNEYKHIIYNKTNFSHFDKQIIETIDLSKMTWSATSLKAYLQCKRKFYLQYILKLKEHEISLKPKGYELGDIIHKILYEYFEKSLDSFERLEELFVKYTQKNPFLTLELEVWKKKIYKVFENEKQRFENIQILHKELPFNMTYQGINIKGAIDRIDKQDDKYLVIDYKTSSSLKVDSLKNYEKSCDFQLEFYYLAVQELYKTLNIESFYYDLNSAKLLKEEALDAKLELLNTIFNSFKQTKEINFEKCEDKALCSFCSYKIICNRE